MKIILTPSEAGNIILKHFAEQNLSATDIEIQMPFDSKPKPCEMAAWPRGRVRVHSGIKTRWKIGFPASNDFALTLV
jgi:hypothetical protein